MHRERQAGCCREQTRDGEATPGTQMAERGAVRAGAGARDESRGNEAESSPSSGGVDGDDGGNEGVSLRPGQSGVELRVFPALRRRCSGGEAGELLRRWCGGRGVVLLVVRNQMPSSLRAVSARCVVQRPAQDPSPPHEEQGPIPTETPSTVHYATTSKDANYCFELLRIDVQNTRYGQQRFTVRTNPHGSSLDIICSLGDRDGSFFHSMLLSPSTGCFPAPASSPELCLHQLRVWYTDNLELMSPDRSGPLWPHPPRPRGARLAMYPAMVTRQGLSTQRIGSL